jgi:hypothetical protein
MRVFAMDYMISHGIYWEQEVSRRETHPANAGKVRTHLMPTTDGRAAERFILLATADCGARRPRWVPYIKKESLTSPSRCQGVVTPFGSWLAD